MKKIEKYIKDLIKETVKEEFNTFLSEDEKVDEPTGGEFGKVLFAPSRRDGVDNEEEDTPREREIFHALINHYQSNDSSDLSKVIPDIEAQIQQNKYNKLLKAPDGKFYRVLSQLSLTRASRILGVSEQDIIDNATNKPWFVKKEIVLQPNTIHKIQSWTSDLISLDFGSFYDQQIELIFEAVNPNKTAFFFMSPEFAGIISRLTTFKSEKESISYGPVTINKVLIYYRDSLKSSKEQSKIPKDMILKLTSFFNRKMMTISNQINKELFDTLQKFPFLQKYDVDGMMEYFDANSIYSWKDLREHINNEKLIPTLDIQEFFDLTWELRHSAPSMIKSASTDFMNKIRKTLAEYEEQQVEYFINLLSDESRYFASKSDKNIFSVNDLDQAQFGPVFNPIKDIIASEVNDFTGVSEPGEVKKDDKKNIFRLARTAKI